MTLVTLKAIRRADLAAISITDRVRTIHVLNRIKAMTAADGSPDEARALAEIADYWAKKTATKTSRGIRDDVSRRQRTTMPITLYIPQDSGPKPTRKPIGTLFILSVGYVR